MQFLARTPKKTAPPPGPPAREFWYGPKNTWAHKHVHSILGYVYAIYDFTYDHGEYPTGEALVAINRLHPDVDVSNRRVLHEITVLEMVLDRSIYLYTHWQSVPTSDRLRQLSGQYNTQKWFDRLFGARLERIANDKSSEWRIHAAAEFAVAPLAREHREHLPPIYADTGLGLPLPRFYTLSLDCDDETITRENLRSRAYKAWIQQTFTSREFLRHEEKLKRVMNALYEYRPKHDVPYSLTHYVDHMQFVYDYLDMQGYHEAHLLNVSLAEDVLRANESFLLPQSPRPVLPRT